VTSPPRVYIVEDDAIIAMELEERMQQMGCVVCGSSARAETALCEVPRFEPDLVLMDNQLTGPMSGMELALRLRRTLPVPIVFLSADPSLAFPTVAPQRIAFVRKPFAASTLRSAVDAVLGGQLTAADAC